MARERTWGPPTLRSPPKPCFCPPAAGFNPTFGPAWVPLYGSLPSRGLRDGLQGLNEGFGQGIWFRGRLLVAVSMEVLEGRAEPEGPQASKGSRLSRLTRKKKKAKQGQAPSGAPAAAAGSSVQGPEIPSAVEVEVEELLPLPEVGAGIGSQGSGVALGCSPPSSSSNTWAVEGVSVVA